MIIANIIIVNQINKKAGKNKSDTQLPALEKGVCTGLNKSEWIPSRFVWKNEIESSKPPTQIYGNLC